MFAARGRDTPVVRAGVAVVAVRWLARLAGLIRVAALSAVARIAVVALSVRCARHTAGGILCVGGPVAVVVDPVRAQRTGLGLARMHVGVGVEAVPFAGPVAVQIRVGFVGGQCPVAVVVQSIAALRSARIYLRIPVVAVGHSAGGADAVAVTICVFTHHRRLTSVIFTRVGRVAVGVDAAIAGMQIARAAHLTIASRAVGWTRCAVLLAVADGISTYRITAACIRVGTAQPEVIIAVIPVV
jgi:hypothetical protein